MLTVDSTLEGCILEASILVVSCSGCGCEGGGAGASWGSVAGRGRGGGAGAWRASSSSSSAPSDTSAAACDRRSAPPAPMAPIAITRCTRPRTAVHTLATGNTEMAFFNYNLND